MGEHANSGRGEEEGISMCVLDCPTSRCRHTKGQIIKDSIENILNHLDGGKGVSRCKKYEEDSCVRRKKRKKSGLGFRGLRLKNVQD